MTSSSPRRHFLAFRALRCIFPSWTQRFGLSRRRVLVSRSSRLVLLDAQPLDLFFQLARFGGLVMLRRRCGHRFVQHSIACPASTAGDVPVAHLTATRGGVENLHAVVRFVTIAQTLEDLDRIFLARAVTVIG